MKQKTGRKLLGVLLTLTMLVGLMPGMSLTAYADNVYSGGTGTETDPWLISTVDDWKALAAAVNGGEAYASKYFRQTADINMSGVDGLVPVGTLAAPFEGNYEGDGFAISNATINVVTTDESTVAGVFGVLTGKGSISNLIVKNATVTATQGSGEWNMAFAGGLVAVVEDAAITDCSVSDSRVTAGGGSDTFSGAVVGYAQSESGEVTTISQIASENNTVVGGGYGGGVLGSFSNDGTLSMTNCYAVGSNVNAQTYSNASMGAFLGASQGGNISLTNCFVYGCSVNATSSSGGKAGLFAADTYHGNVSATNTYYYDTNNLPANAESAIVKTEEEMKSLASELGGNYAQGSKYPILLHPVTAPKITGADLVLNGSLDFRFYVALPVNFDSNGAHMVFTVHGRTIDVPFAEAEISTEDATLGQRIFPCPVYSIEMAEDVKAEFRYGAGKTVTKERSIKDYLDALDVQTSDAALKNLINATRDYGHYIQPYLSKLHNFKIGTGGYAVMPAATESLAPTTVTELDGFKTKWNRYDGNLLESVTYYDTFDTSTFLNVQVKLKSARTLTATVGGAAVEVTELGGNVYAVRTPGIAANSLGTPVNVVFYAGSTVICDIDVSTLTYVRAVLASRNETDEAAALTAFYNYYVAAKDYAN